MNRACKPVAETGDALYRAWLIEAQGHLVYRPDWADYAMVRGNSIFLAGLALALQHQGELIDHRLHTTRLEPAGRLWSVVRGLPAVQI